MNKIQLKENWKLISSDDLKETDGNIISSMNFDTGKWYPAKVPSTVVAVLVENEVYKDPYIGTNLNDISPEQFKVPWWYRTEFEISEELLNQSVLISFNGINYKANIWINGKLIADGNTVFGAFRHFNFNISDFLQMGKNILAIEVIPPKPGDFTIGFVDWNPSPPDNNIGIFREVILHFNKGVSIQNPFVESKLYTDSLKKADLEVTAELQNHSDKIFDGLLVGKIEDIEISKPVKLDIGERKKVSFKYDEFSELSLNDAKVWWPNNLGDQPLYILNLRLICADDLIDESSTKFGIRKVEDYINPGGHRGFKINGHKVLIRGAGWTDDLFLQDTTESLETQIQYVKDMNLNCIRLEGFWGKDHKLYDLCDENGILMMVGWSCQWEHEQYLGKPVHPKYGGVIEQDEMELVSKSWEDQIIWLRNHPSIFVWTVGSDMLPHPDLERRYIDTFEKYDSTRPYLNSTGGVGSEQGIITSEEIISEISGSSRVKMLGPYAYTPPVYWYTNKNLGGAYGFNTETCPGANIPPIESLRKFIPNNNLWPTDEVWNFHCGKNYFSNIDRTKEAIEKRYGEPKNVEDFAFKAQILNYELMRPMFEAFQINQQNATGIIQWMLNSAWPEMYWQLYDIYLMPNGAYYGAKKANEPIQLIYNYGDKSIYILNNTLRDVKDLVAKIRIFDIHSKNILEKSIGVNINSGSSKLIFTVSNELNLTPVYFLDLRIFSNEKDEIASNFYWLSLKEDILDYEAKVEGWSFYTPSKQYSDFTSLDKLERIDLMVSNEFDSSEKTANIKLENSNDTIAFFVELLFFDRDSNEVILPTFWSDNYVSLLPNEEKFIRAEFKNPVSKNAVLRLKGYNIK